MRVKHLKRVTNFIVAHHRVVAVVLYLLGAASTLIVLSLARNVFVDENAFLLNQFDKNKNLDPNEVVIITE